MILDEEALSIIPPRGFVHGFCSYVYKACDGPVIFSLGTALAVVGAVTDPEMVLPTPDPVPASFWSLIAGPSSSRKTTIGNIGMSILRAVDPSKIGSEEESEAALLESLSATPQQLHYFGEYGAFLSGTGGNSYKKAVKDRYCDLWTGHDLSKHSLKSGLITVHRPRLSKLACVAYGMLEQHTNEYDWTGGFLTRFCCFASRRTRTLALIGRDIIIGDMDPNDPNAPKVAYHDPAQRQGLIEYLDLLASISLPPPKGLTVEAHAIYAPWAAACDPANIHISSSQRWVDGVYGRLDTMALRIAMLLSLDFGEANKAYREGRTEWAIGAEEMYYAILITNAHMKSVGHVIGGLALGPFARQRRSVLEVFTPGEVLTEGQILQRAKPELSKRQMREVVDTLELEGQLHKSVPSGAGMGWALGPVVTTQVGEED